MLYLAPSLLQSIRINFTTLELSWQPSQGATQYRLIQTYTNGTLIYSNDFGNINSTIVNNLEPYVQYIFTIYPGNENGFDLSEGKSAILSTESLFFFLFFFSFSSFSFSSVNQPF